MRITANQVTTVRLVLLPVPVAMVHYGVFEGGGRGWLAAALGVYVVLGLTDALDGILARRHGVTPLGSLLDPVADKIFLVASYALLVHLGTLAAWPVVVLFVRELAVTTLRSLALEESFDFRTSNLAKLKTTVQMSAAGFMLLLGLVPSDRAILVLLSVAAGLSWIPALRSVLRGARPGWRAQWGGALISLVAVLRALLPAHAVITALMAIVLLFTVVTGFEYAWGMRSVLAARLQARPLDGLRYALLALVVPCAFVPWLGQPGAPSYRILGLVAAELAAGGLDNSLTQAGGKRSPRFDLLRSSTQLALGIAGLLDPALRPPAVTAALAVTLADVIGRLLVDGRRLQNPVA